MEGLIMSKESVEISLTIKQETNAAYLVTDGDVTVWLPKSQLEYQETLVSIGDTVIFSIPEWLAEKNDLI